MINANGDDSVYVSSGDHKEMAVAYVPCYHCELCVQSRKSDLVRRAQFASYEFDCPPFTFRLTYDAVHLPKYGELQFRDVQLFFKRLRKRLAHDGLPTDFKYIVAGEYGSERGRPHYHVILFNNPFRCSEYDVLKVNLLKRIIWECWRKDLWPVFDDPRNFGQCYGGIAAYVAKYVGKRSHWEERFIPEAGRTVHPMFVRTSVGLGHGYLSRFSSWCRVSKSSEFEYFDMINGQYRTCRMTKSLRRFFHPTPLQMVKSSVKDAYKDMANVLLQLVELGEMPFDVASGMLDECSLGVFSNKLTVNDARPSRWYGRCSTFKRLVSRRLQTALYYDYSCLVDYGSVDSEIDRYYSFKDSQIVKEKNSDFAFDMARLKKQQSVVKSKSVE